MRELKLAINVNGWVAFTSREASEQSVALLDKIKNRDNYVCYFCGFQAYKFQHVVNLDSNYNNNTEDNLVTACCFCSQCLFFQSVGLDNMSGGQLIYLPEIPQATLNSLIHVLFVAMGSDTSFNNLANDIYRNLRLRSQAVENKFGQGGSNPVVMAQLILEYAELHPKFSFTKLMSGLRLLANYKKFSMQLEAWAQEAAQ